MELLTELCLAAAAALLVLAMIAVFLGGTFDGKGSKNGKEVGEDRADREDWEGPDEKDEKEDKEEKEEKRSAVRRPEKKETDIKKRKTPDKLCERGKTNGHDRSRRRS